MTEDTVTVREMRQVAPYPVPLVNLIATLRYARPGADRLQFHLGDLDRGQGCAGLTLTITRHGPDAYNPERFLTVNHYFPVPPAAYGLADWRRWLFDRISDVERHERMEWFAFLPQNITEGSTPEDPECWERPYRPVHAPGFDPYVVHDPATEVARRTSFRGEVNPA